MSKFKTKGSRELKVKIKLDDKTVFERVHIVDPAQHWQDQYREFRNFKDHLITDINKLVIPRD